MSDNRIEAISDGASPVRGASPGRSPARTGRDDRILKTVLALVIGNPRMGRGQTGPRIHHGLVQVSKAPLSSTVQVLQGVTSRVLRLPEGNVTSTFTGLSTGQSARPKWRRSGF